MAVKKGKGELAAGGENKTKFYLIRDSPLSAANLGVLLLRFEYIEGKKLQRERAEVMG